MAIFAYIAKDQEGKTRAGTIEAPNIEGAHELLRERKYIVISLEERKESALASLFKRVRGVPLDQKALFTRQLATMLGAGLNLTMALEVLHSQASSPRMKEVLTEMRGDVEGGSSLSKSMRKYPDVFSHVFVALMEAGEASGKVETILLSLADKLEREREFRGKIMGALIYPAIVVIVMMVVFVIMIAFVMPRLTEMYKDIGAELPLPTKILLGITGLMAKWLWLLPILAVLGFLAFRQFVAGDYGRRKWNELIFKIPIVGKLSKEVQLTEFCQTLALLMGAGVPITQCLEIVAEVMGNIIYREAVLNAGKQVEKGVPLSTPLKANPAFPPMVSQMIRVGEETGKIDETLLKVGAFFEAEAERTIKTISVVLEPALLILLALMVGPFVITIITSIYGLTAQL